MRTRLARYATCVLAAAVPLVLTSPGAIVGSASGAPAGTSESGIATASAGTPQPLGVPGSWKLRFQDNFSGTQLNHDKWQPNWLGATDKTVTRNFHWREKNCYDPAQVKVLNGSVRLRAEKRDCRASTGKVYPYASGLIQSSDDFTFTYGYAETRMYLPRNTDPALGAVGSCGPNWAAFWLNGDNWPYSGEIDVMECLGKDDVNWHYHWKDGEAGRSPSGWNGKMPGTTGWHTFGVDWQPNSLTFYYDGKEVGRHTVGVTNQPHWLTLNLSISGTKIKAPQTVKIDHVRVWQRA